MLSLTSGMRLGRYRLESLIGAGGMAEVWRGFDPQLERPVAVKVVQPSIARDPAFEERFAHEARVAASLVHPHIVPVYDSGYDGDTAYIVMALLLGGDLRDTRRTARGREKPLAWLAPLAAALDYAHGKGIVHRDVKPANVLFDEAGRLFLSDFGLAKLVRGLGLTSSGLVLGTPGYMSPEQAQGRAVDGRSDQFSLGIVAFWLLTGQTPFEGDSGIAILHQIVHQKAPAVSKVNPAVSPLLDAVVERALSKDPADRYPTCRAFVEAIHGALGGTPPPSMLDDGDTLTNEPAASRQETRREGPPPTVSMPSSRSRRARLAVPATIVAAAAVVLFVALRSGGGDPEPAARDASRPREVPAETGTKDPEAGPANAAEQPDPARAEPSPTPRPTAAPAGERRPAAAPATATRPPHELAPGAEPSAAEAPDHGRGPLVPAPAATAVPTAAPDLPPALVEKAPAPLAARIEILRRLVEGEDGRVRVTLTESEAAGTPHLDVGSPAAPARTTRLSLRRLAAVSFEATIPRLLVRGELLQMTVTLDPSDGSGPRRSAPQTFPVVPRTEHAIPVLP